MLSNNETQLLFTLMQNEAISLVYAALISGYDSEYSSDLLESIGQEGIEIRRIEIEDFDAEGKPVTTHAVMLPESERIKVAAFIHNIVKNDLDGIDPDEVIEDLKLIQHRYAAFR